MFDFRRDQNKFNNNGGQPSLGNMGRQSNFNSGNTGITPGSGFSESPNRYNQQAPSASPNLYQGGEMEESPYRNISRDNYLNQRYRNPQRQNMGRQQRNPMELRRLEEEKRRRLAMQQRYGRYMYNGI